MINVPSSSARTFVFDLYWEKAALCRLKENFNLESREIILPAFIYSLTANHSSYSLSLFFEARDQVAALFDAYLEKTPAAICDYDALQRELYAEIQCLGKHLSAKTESLRSWVNRPHQIRQLRLSERSLYVTLSLEDSH